MAKRIDESVTFSRRRFLEKTGMGLGALGLSTLLGTESFGESQSGPPLYPRSPHFPAKCKHVIQVFASGAPSHIDSFDPKPMLKQYHGKPIPGESGVAFGSPFKFQAYGQSGIEVSELFPHMAQHVDDMAVIRSMWTDNPTHNIGTVLMNTGSQRAARPSLGAWAIYGMGSPNQNMPGFISLKPGGNVSGGSQNWQSAFLPGVYQGTSINTSESSIDQMIPNIRSEFSSYRRQRRQLDLVKQLNENHQGRLQDVPELEARINAFEMAFKMQTEATDAFDISLEPQYVRDAYGEDTQGKQLLMARRLVERGVRFVQVWHGGWDHHTNIEPGIRKQSSEIDRPLAALITDLKQRGLLDSTLVVWGGEFGRSSTMQKGSEKPGRGHNNHGFSVLMAGGGVKGGMIHGATDEFGSKAVTDRVHVHDLHATILRLLGFDHESLTYRVNGRDFRLTDTAGRIVDNIIA